ncbi:MAG: transglutaminase-like domain-containing protein [Bryobacterales bacterium]|nr:transglutaminase-like domain-containing protein [Bryobacterales bacterium]
MNILRLILCVTFIASASLPQISGIEVTGQAQPNCWRVDELVREVTKGATTDREKALALYRFGMEHIIHFNGPIEQGDLYVTDPTKIIGVYGYALCGNNSSAMNALYEAAGLKARVRWLKYHEVPEVWFENRWNYLDSDMFGYVYLDDGKTIAGVDDLIRDADLFTRQKNPPIPYFPFDKKSDMASVFRNAFNRKNYHAHPDTHLMRLALRTGESVRMFYRPQDRFYLREGLPYNLGTQYRDYWTLGPVRKDSYAWTDESPAAYGNARFDYRPRLGSVEFRNENPEIRDVTYCEGRQMPALCAAPGATAFMVVDVTTPFVIAGLQNDLSNFSDNSNGAIISGQFWRNREEDWNTISISVDNGNSWHEVWRNRLIGAIPFRVDVTPLVEGYSGYKVKFEWTDTARQDKSGVSDLAFETWTELSPMALPRLVAGENTFKVAARGEAALFENSAWHRQLTLRDESRENLEYHSDAPYLRPQSGTRPGVLEFVLPDAKAAKELRVSILARALPGGDPKNIRVALSISDDGGHQWRELEHFAPNPEQEDARVWFNHRSNRSEGISGQTRLRIAVTGGGLERVATSVLSAQPVPSSAALRITHVWLEGNTQKSAVNNVKLINGEGSYRVATGAEIRNRELRIEAVAP